MDLIKEISKNLNQEPRNKERKIKEQETRNQEEEGRRKNKERENICCQMREREDYLLLVEELVEEGERRRENGEPTSATQGEISSPVADSKYHRFFISFKTELQRNVSFFEYY